MDEKVLLDWKEAHADIYSKFKQDLETQLQKSYHEWERKAFRVEAICLVRPRAGDASIALRRVR